jgi:hypothetical protein
MVSARRVVRWSSKRGKQLYSIHAGRCSARSPKHYPIELALQALAVKRAKAKAFQQERDAVKSHLDTARKLLNSTREHY